jgi:hypothetical protein
LPAVFHQIRIKIKRLGSPHIIFRSDRSGSAGMMKTVTNHYDARYFQPQHDLDQKRRSSQN